MSIARVIVEKWRLVISKYKCNHVMSAKRRIPRDKLKIMINFKPLQNELPKYIDVHSDQTLIWIKHVTSMNIELELETKQMYFLTKLILYQIILNLIWLYATAL